MSGLTIRRVVLAHPGECTEGVTRHDEFQPCDKPAVALRLDPECGEAYPVCARHARADMVPLPDVIAAVREQIAAEIDKVAQSCFDGYAHTSAYAMWDAARIARGQS